MSHTGIQAPKGVFSANGRKPLDTLAQLASDSKTILQRSGESFEQSCSLKSIHTVFRKRAKAKAFTNKLALTLIHQVPDSPLVKQYRSSYYCTSVLVQEGNNITSHYCGQRWCAVCNGIRTGKNLNRFAIAFKNLKEPMFLTLTAPTISADLLNDEIDLRLQQFSRAVKSRKQYLRRQGESGQVQIIRKLEVTYSNGKYHPHFHCIVEGKQNAEALMDYWLSTRTDATRSGQDCKPADLGSLSELFKYTTKLVSGKKGQKKIYPAQVLDTIFQALHTRRTFQTYGSLEQAIEEVENYQSVGFNVPAASQSFVWFDDYSNWMNRDTGELVVDTPDTSELHSIFSDST
jgi:hypothetical protein